MNCFGSVHVEHGGALFIDINKDECPCSSALFIDINKYECPCSSALFIDINKYGCPCSSALFIDINKDGCPYVWAAVFTFNPYLLISLNEIIDINNSFIDINKYGHSIHLY